MPQSKPRRRKGNGEVVMPLSVSERIFELLKLQANTFPPKELSQDEVERWIRDLEPFSLEAIEYAFDKWRTNGRFFPVPADILDLCSSWNPPEMERKGCNAECRSRHGKGYGGVDMEYLYERYNQKRSELNRVLTDGEINLLLEDLDKKRGHAPDWRKMV
jgi:hypothetical protein